MHLFFPVAKAVAHQNRGDLNGLSGIVGGRADSVGRCQPMSHAGIREKSVIDFEGTFQDE